MFHMNFVKFCRNSFRNPKLKSGGHVPPYGGEDFMRIPRRNTNVYLSGKCSKECHEAGRDPSNALKELIRKDKPTNVIFKT